MTRPACSQLRTRLKEIKELKAEFDLELPKIKDTRNTAPVLGLEKEIREKIKLIKELLTPTHYEWVEITVGTKSKEELFKELEKREKANNPEEEIYIYDYDEVKNMFQSPDFTVTNKVEKITLIRLKVKDLGFKQQPTTNEIYQRAKEQGLELCSPEIGPHLRLNYREVFNREQPKDTYFYIGMKPITNSRNYPGVFSVGRNDDGERWLDYYRAGPEDRWSLKNEFIFTNK